MQFGAVARSGFLVADHPTDEDRRVVVMGKANYAAKTSMSFELGVEEFVLDGRVFKVTCARDFQPEQIDMAEALKGRRGERGPSVKDQVKQAIRDALADGSATKSQVAKTIERELDNSTLKKAWTELAEAGELKQDDENRWWWSSPIEATTTTTNTDDEDDR